jgi:hypothetical protein
MDDVMLRVHSADLHNHVAQEIGECLETGGAKLARLDSRNFFANPQHRDYLLQNIMSIIAANL